MGEKQLEQHKYLNYELIQLKHMTNGINMNIDDKFYIFIKKIRII